MLINRVSPVTLMLWHLVLLVPGMTRADGGTRLVCYFTNWSPGRSGEYSFNISNIPVDLCTHVSYTFAGVDEHTFELKSTNPSFDILQKGYEKFANLKKEYPELKLSLAVGGWAHGAEPFRKMASSLTARETFIASVIEFMERYSFDGIEIVWLWPGSVDRGGTPSDKDNLYVLIVELKNSFRQAGHESWEVYVQVPMERNRIDVGYHQSQLCRVADYLYITGYDLRGSWNGFTDIHSPMNPRQIDSDDLRDLNVKGGVQRWIKNGCLAHKIVLGVPLFGRTYTLQNEANTGLVASTSGPGRAGPYTGEGGYWGYFEICEEMKQSTWTVEWDERGMCPYAYHGNQWVGYENEQSLEEKARYAKKQKLGGMYAFSLDLDDYKGECGIQFPLLKALRNTYKPRRLCSSDSNNHFAIDREPCFVQL